MSDKDFFVHPNALCETENIGKNTRVWAFAHILKGAKIGEDCNFCDGVFVENEVLIGDRVTVKNGVHIWDGVTIEDDVFLGPSCVLTNDVYPRSKGYHPSVPTLIKKGASIGANATLVCGITIGKYSLIGAGSVVTKDVPDFALLIGNPARIKSWVSKTGEKLNFDSNGNAEDNKGNKYKHNKDDHGKERVIES